MRYWNHAAGWKLFVFSPDSPEVTYKFDRHARASALCHPSWSSPFESCTISLAREYRDSVQTIAHEFGHALGFRHQRRGVMDSKIDIRFDRRLLIEAGYRG